MGGFVHALVARIDILVRLSSLRGNSGPLREIFGLVLFCFASDPPCLPQAVLVQKDETSVRMCYNVLSRVTCLMLCPYCKRQNEQLHCFQVFRSVS